MKFSKVTADMRMIAMAAGMLVASISAAYAASITTLFNTGVDASHNVLANGAVDPHYTVSGGGVGPATYLENPPHPSYFPNSAVGGLGSAWIWHSASGNEISNPETYNFSTTFNLTGFNPATAAISGLWGTDNQGIDILLNGHSLGISLLGVIVENFNTLHTFNIGSGFFQAGLNTLTFVVQNNGGPGAFRAELSGTVSAVPIPAALPLFASGLAAFGVFARRRRKAAA